MQERPFLDKANQPTEQAIRATLGEMYTCYITVMSLTNSYSQEWAFSKSSGWMLKIADHKKALLYLIPLNNGFKINLTIRENERAAFLCDDDLATLHEQILSAKKYIEGFAMHFELADIQEFQRAEVFIRKLIAART